MKLLLRLKHWQLFLLTWGFATIVFVLTFFTTGIEELFVLPFMMVFFICGTYGWIWAIALNLHSKLPSSVKINLTTFKILMAIPTLYLIGVTILIPTIKSTLPGDNPTTFSVAFIILALHFTSIVCVFLALRLAVKIMRSVELQRMAKFGDYAGEFVLVWFQPIGVWVIQPRVNQLMNS